MKNHNYGHLSNLTYVAVKTGYKNKQLISDPYVFNSKITSIK